MKLFSGSSNSSLSLKISKLLHISVSPVDIHVFPDGEKRVRINDNVVGQQTVVVQSTVPPVDNNYMELFFIVDALKRSGAEFVTAVVPYLGYQRQDHVFRDGEAVSLEVVIKTLERVGLDTIILCDLHSIKIPSVFSIPVTHVSALPIFAEKIKQENWNDKNTILISPDMGGIRRIKILSELLDNMAFAAIEKDRDLQSGWVTAESLGEGKIANQKRAIIVDDMISSGKTIIAAAEVLIKKGIEEIIVFATHPIFSEKAPRLLENANIKKVFVTDTVFVPEDKHFAKLEILSIAAIIAKELETK
ncbi:MAG TPA: ribose-phosphate diphosphokinase [Patescibacteria group bacterium]